MEGQGINSAFEATKNDIVPIMKTNYKVSCDSFRVKTINVPLYPIIASIFWPKKWTFFSGLARCAVVQLLRRTLAISNYFCSIYWTFLEYLHILYDAIEGDATLVKSLNIFQKLGCKMRIFFIENKYLQISKTAFFSSSSLVNKASLLSKRYCPNKNKS
jgi:hypothetical protein